MNDLRTLVQRQRDFFRSGATRSLEWRRARLESLRQALRTHEAALEAALHADLGKGAYEAHATEVGVVSGEINHALRHLGSWMRPRRRGTPWIAWPGRSWIQPEPYGVALILGPWNYPVQLMLAPLVGALAAGNCAVLKPSELAPRTAAALAALLASVFPTEQVAVVEGDRSVAEALLGERFDVLFFTGSPAVGRAVMAAAARHLTPVTLELGGKSPCILCADAPLELAARRIAWGKFLNAGQTCVAPDYVLVERAVAEEFLRALRGVLKSFYGEDPQRSPEYGRIVNARHFERLAAYLRDGTIASGGGSHAATRYLEPTLLTRVRLDAPVMQEEIFGPILPVLEFERLEEALEVIRERPVPLALYLFTRDRGIQERVLAETRSGGVCLNDVVLHIVGSGLPFGGLGESGLGAYHGRASFDCFTHQRSVLRRSLGVDPSLRYPPPRIRLPTLKRVMGFLLRG